MTARTVLTSCALWLLLLFGAGTQSRVFAQVVGGVSGFGVGIGPPSGSWVLRVNTEATNAHRIVWHVDTLDGTAGAGDWWFHSGSTRTTLGLPNNVVGNAPDVNMRLTAEPPETHGSVCIFFKNAPVQRVEFTGQRQFRLNSEQRDQSCSPTRN